MFMYGTIPNWAFLLILGLAANIGVALARRFHGVKIGLGVLCVAVTVPVVLAILLIDGPVPVTYASWSLVLIAGLICLGIIDAQTHTVPDLIAIPMILLGLAHAATQDNIFTVFAVSSIGVVAFGLVVGVLIKGRAGWIGGGDVLLFSGSLAWLGPALVPDILLLSGVGLLLQIVGRYLLNRVQTGNRENTIGFTPLSPALGVAQMVIWLGGPLF